jgi:DNA-binding NarL/FixJ family response regulator
VSAIYYDLDSCRKGLTSFRPDVLLLDVELPDGNGVDFCAEILTLYPDLKILMLTGYEELSIAQRSLHNGAFGYVLKNVLSEEVLVGIQEVNSGNKYICEKIDERLNEKAKEKTFYLTAREKNVLQFIVEGYTNPEIAERLFLSKDSVKTYRKRLLVKFKVNNSVGLVKKAMEQKLI